jgi:hypothetical protein
MNTLLNLKTFLTATLMSLFGLPLLAQNCYWQQHVKYVMNIDMNVETNKFIGKQRLEYTNSSPDTLKKVFYHLYWNAFQPGSMMDEDSRRHGGIKLGNSTDWDDRVEDRISKLKPEEMGYQKILSLKMDGLPQKYEVQETILLVTLSKPILPGQKAIFDMDFEAQVPLMIRRSGRDNPETKVRYSMSQWYPKMCEYDKQGWHPTPYIAREFYGVFGDFDVNITIDKKYILGGTGYLLNANQIGYGYESSGTKVVPTSGKKLTWKFTANNVHDFVWAADPEFIHKSKKIKDGLTLHLIYKPGVAGAGQWENILTFAEKAFPYIEKNFGAYPYKQFSFIEGGDGGMEYPMATLLTEPGAWLHELMHNWYYGIIANNENRYAWMDEGFATYADNVVAAWLKNSIATHESDYKSYFNLVKSGFEEPMNTPADHFNTYLSYNISSYSKGTIFLQQLGYIVGAQVRDNILLYYYQKWKLKHPAPDDFITIAQHASDIQLDWYLQYWVNSTHTIDYAIDSLWEDNSKTKIRLRCDGTMPMPIDFQLTFKDGSKEMHYIPLDLMYNIKPAEDPAIPRIVYPAWHWTSKTYTIESSKHVMDISVAEIDPSQRMADVERRNNKIELKY